MWQDMKKGTVLLNFHLKITIASNVDLWSRRPVYNHVGSLELLWPWNGDSFEKQQKIAFCAIWSFFSCSTTYLAMSGGLMRYMYLIQYPLDKYIAIMLYQECINLAKHAREHMTSREHRIDSKIQTWWMYCEDNSFIICVITKQKSLIH